MREFSEFEQSIITALADIKRTNKLENIDLQRLIRQSLSALAVNWSLGGSTEKGLIRVYTKYKDDSHKALYEVIDLIVLLIYLRDNGLIFLFDSGNTNDNWIYDRETINPPTEDEKGVKFTNKISKTKIDGSTEIGTALIYYPTTERFYSNLPTYLNEFSNSYIYPTQELIDLVNNEFKTAEQLKFDIQRKDIWIGIWIAIGFGVIGIIFNIVTLYKDSNGNHITEIINNDSLLQNNILPTDTLTYPIINNKQQINSTDTTKVLPSTKTKIPAVIETRITNDTIKVQVVKPMPIKRNSNDTTKQNTTL